MVTAQTTNLESLQTEFPALSRRRNPLRGIRSFSWSLGTMPAENGFVKVHRCVRGHWLWEKPVSKFQAWADILMLANWERGKQLVGNQVVTLERGQLLVSERFLANRWEWSRKRVASFLKLLSDDEMVVLKRGQLGANLSTVMTVLNYDKYQAWEPATGPQRSHRGASNGTKEKKKKEETNKKQEKKAVQIPEELKTPEFEAAWCEFEQHRREIRKPLTPTSAKRQLASLSKMGLERAIDAIRHTIEKGWQGIREREAGFATKRIDLDNLWKDDPE